MFDIDAPPTDWTDALASALGLAALWAPVAALALIAIGAAIGAAVGARPTPAAANRLTQAAAATGAATLGALFLLGQAAGASPNAAAALTLGAAALSGAVFTLIGAALACRVVGRAGEPAPTRLLIGAVVAAALLCGLDLAARLGGLRGDDAMALALRAGDAVALAAFGGLFALLSGVAADVTRRGGRGYPGGLAALQNGLLILGTVAGASASLIDLSAGRLLAREPGDGVLETLAHLSAIRSTTAALATLASLALFAVLTLWALLPRPAAWCER